MNIYILINEKFYIKRHTGTIKQPVQKPAYEMCLYV